MTEEFKIEKDEQINFLDLIVDVGSFKDVSTKNRAGMRHTKTEIEISLTLDDLNKSFSVVVGEVLQFKRFSITVLDCIYGVVGVKPYVRLKIKYF